MAHHQIFIVCGLPGVGKSTYGSKLAKAKQAMLLDIDTCTELLVKAGLSAAGHDANDRDSPYFKRNYRQPIYDTLFAVAKENIGNLPVVIVGPFTNEVQQVDWPMQLSQKLLTSVEVHYLQCSSDERKRRIIERNNARDLAKLSNWERETSSSNYINIIRCPHLFINTD